MLSCCQIYFCEQETTGIVYHHRSESLIRSRLFLLEPVCFLISHWDAYMPWHDRALSSSTSFSIRVLHQPQAQVAMHWGTPATLSYISSEAKIYWGQNLLLWFIPFLILIISKWCLYFLLFSLSHEFIRTSKKSNQTEGNEMQSKSFHCQTTIKCYGHIKAYRARWSAQWEYDILHCAGPHSGLCRQLQKNLTIRKNSL